MFHNDLPVYNKCFYLSMNLYTIVATNLLTSVCMLCLTV